jgi:uncharacterized membrane protein YkoI
MRTRSLLFASALVLASAAGTLALNGVQVTRAAGDGAAGTDAPSVQQQTPATEAELAPSRDGMRRQQSRDDAVAVKSSRQAMPLEDVIRELSRQGYGDIREVERAGPDRYEVYARDADGRRVELKVDAVTGKVLEREEEDD